MWLIYSSFRTPYRHYADMFDTHQPTTRKENVLTIQMIRPATEVMLSLYRMRSRFGIGNVSFADFLRTPYVAMPKVSQCRIIKRFPNEELYTECTHMLSPVDKRPLDHWQYVVRNHCECADIQIQFSELVSEPQRIIEMIAKAVSWPFVVESVQLPKERVGWFDPNEQEISATKSDVALMAAYDQATAAMQSTSMRVMQ